MPAVLDATDRLVRRVVSAEAQLRPEYLRFDTREVEQLCDGVELADLLGRVSALLRAMLAAACAIEVLEPYRLGGEEPPEATELTSRIATKCGFDPLEAAREALRLIPTPAPSQTGIPSLAFVLREVRSALTSCPIADIESMAREHDLAARAHECRLAYDGLRAFVRRVDPELQARVRIVGEVYQLGAMSTEQVAIVLECSPADAAAELEAHGYARPLEVIRLEEPRRAQLLAAIRRQRQNDPRAWRSPTEDETARHAIASERIEGIDARRWL